jgi:hypothetical protein
MFEKIHRNLIMFTVSVSTLPLFVLFVTVTLNYLKIGEVNDKITVSMVVVSFVCFIVLVLNIAAILFYSTFINGMMIRLKFKIRDYVTKEEEEKIFKLSQGNSYEYIVNLMRKIGENNEKSGIGNHIENSMKKAENSLLKCIIFVKEPHNSFYHLKINDYWYDNYQYFFLKDKCVLTDYMGKSDTEIFNNQMAYMAEREGRTDKCEVELRISPHAAIYVTIVTVSTASSEGTIQVIGLIQDANDEHKFKSYVQDVREKFSFALEASSKAIYEIDINNNKAEILTVPQWDRLFGDKVRFASYSEFCAVYIDRIHTNNRNMFVENFCSTIRVSSSLDKKITYRYYVRNWADDFVEVEQTAFAYNNKIISRIHEIEER